MIVIQVEMVVLEDEVIGIHVKMMTLVKMIPVKIILVGRLVNVRDVHATRIHVKATKAVEGR